MCKRERDNYNQSYTIISQFSIFFCVPIQKGFFCVISIMKQFFKRQASSFSHHRTERVFRSRNMAPGMDLELEVNTHVRDVQKMNAVERLTWANKTHPGHVAMSTSFGIHSAVLLHLATQVDPDIPVIWIDTGYLPAETYRYAETLQDELDLNLFVSTSAITPARMEATYGKLWEHQNLESHQLYGLMRKNEPLKRSMQDLDVKCLVVGLRSDQTKERANMSPLTIQYDAMKLLPILEMSKSEVLNYMEDNNLPRHPLESQGYVSVGDWHSSRPKKEGEDDRETRFGGVAQECGLHTDGIATTTTTTTPVDVKTPLGGEILDAYNLDNNTKHPTVLMVKKRMSDGGDCKRCVDIQKRLDTDGIVSVERTLYAEEGVEESDGVRLSKEFGMRTAPFFLVKQPGSESFEAVESYFKVKKMMKDFGLKEENEDIRPECEIDFTYDGVHYTEGDCEPGRTKQHSA